MSSVNNITTTNYTSTPKLHNYYVASGVDKKFSDSISETLDYLGNFSDKTKDAVSELENVIISKNSESEIPEGFDKTEYKLHKYAEDAFGFVSKPDNAIVIIKNNHKRKIKELEGDINTQGADTVTHEVGHLLDNNFSTGEKFKNAYLKDLQNIAEQLKCEDAKICDTNLKEMVVYLKHYMEGVNFEDGIDESDITREGLRENFAECFSTIADLTPTKINEIYSALFPNTMEATREFVI